MKRCAAAILLSVLALQAIGQTKEEKQQRKEQEKAMLRRDPESEIAAAVDPVKAMLVRKMTVAGWQIENESQFQLSFSRAAETSGEVWGLMLGAQVHGDDPSLPTIHVQFTIAPAEKCTTLIRFSTSLSYSTRGGRTLTTQNGGMRTYKPRILALLDEMKGGLERESSCPAGLTS